MGFDPETEYTEEGRMANGFAFWLGLSLASIVAIKVVGLHVDTTLAKSCVENIECVNLVKTGLKDVLTIIASGLAGGTTLSFSVRALSGEVIHEDEIES